MNHQPQNIANEPMDAQLQTNVSVGPSGSNGRSASLIPSRMPLKKRTCQELPMTCNGYVSYNPRDSFSGGYSGDRTGNVSGLDNGYDGGDSDSFTGDETTDSHRKSKAKFEMKKPSRVIISIAKKKRKYSGNASISPITSSLSSLDENENCKPPKSVRPGEERVQRKVKFVSFLTYQDEEDVASPNLKHDNQDARSSKDMKKNSGDSMISSLTSNDYGPSKSSLCLGKDAGVTQSVTAKHPREDESVNTNNAPRVNPADESSYGMKIRPAPWYCYVSCFFDFN